MIWPSDHHLFFATTWGRAKRFADQGRWAWFRLWLHSLFCKGC